MFGYGVRDGDTRTHGIGCQKHKVVISAKCVDSILGVGLFHPHLTSPSRGRKKEGTSPSRGRKKEGTFALLGVQMAPLPWREGLGEGESPRSFFGEHLPRFVGLRRSLARLLEEL